MKSITRAQTLFHRLQRCSLPAAALALLLAAPAGAAPVGPLQGYGADLRHTSVSGLSSGAFMAAQFDVAFSGELVGAGIIAGGPFYCAGLFEPTPPMQAAMTHCMSPLGSTGPRAEDALAQAKRLAQAGKIDAVEGLAHQRVYVFSGTMDRTVEQRVVNQTASFFSLAGVGAASLKYVNNIAAGHAIITDNVTDVPCEQSRDPYINNCGFEQSHEILKWIYGSLKPPAKAANGQFLLFDQQAFDPDDQALLDRYGYVYVPRACHKGACRVHVVFHGCEQGEQLIGDRYARTTGYNELAEANRLIVLYPQVAPSPRNPKGCWDFWGYTSPQDTQHPDFYSRQAPQMAAVMRMVERLGEHR